MTATGEAPPPSYPTFVVLSMTIVQVLATMTLFTPATMAPELAARLDVDASLLGYQISITYITAALSSLTAGGIVSRFGACRTSQISLVLSAIGILLFLIPSILAMSLGSLVIGWGYGLTNPASAQLLQRITGEGRRNLIFSLKQTGVPLGVLAAGLIIPPTTLSFGTDAAFLVVAALTLAWAIALQPIRQDWDADRDPKRRITARPLAGFNVIMRTPALRYLSMTAFCYAGIQIGLTAYTVTLLVKDLGYGLIAAGVVLSVMQVSGTVGRIIWGWLADRTGRSLMVLACLGGVMTISCLAVGLMTPDWSVLLVQGLFVVFGAAALGWNGIFMANIARLAPRGEVGSAVGGGLAVTFSGVVALPTLFAIAFSLSGSYTLTFAFASVAGVVGAALTLVAGRAAGREPPSANH